MSYSACFVGLLIGSIMLCAIGEATWGEQSERLVGAGIALFCHWAISALEARNANRD